jgi:hypothetical protein
MGTSNNKAALSSDEIESGGPKERALGTVAEASPKSASARARPAQFRGSCARLLVRERGAFYNPRNTPAAAVVSFTRVPSTQPPNKMEVLFASECLNIDLHFEFSRSTE